MRRVLIAAGAALVLSVGMAGQQSGGSPILGPGPSAARFPKNAAEFDQMFEKLGKVGSQRHGINVKFLDQLKISRINRRHGGHQLPHARSHGIQPEIPFGIQVKEHRFLVQKTDQNV